MGKINKVLLMFIAMGAIMIAAVGVDRGMQYLEDQKWEARRQERYQKASADVASIEMTISQLARDPEALEAYLAEHRAYFDNMEELFGEREEPGGPQQTPSGEENTPDQGDPAQDGEQDPAGEEGNASDGMNGGFSEGGDVSGAGAGVSGNSPEPSWPDQNFVSGNEMELPPATGAWFFPDGSWMPGNGGENFPGGVWMPGDQIEGFPEGGPGQVSGNSPAGVSDNGMGNMLGSGVSSNGIFQVSGNELWSLSGEYRWDPFRNVWRDISGNMVDPLSLTQESAPRQDTVAGQESGDLTLADRRRIRSSYMETSRQSRLDRDTIAGKKADFSQVSIACLGDSITEAANLSDLENYRQYSYPTRLGELLGAEKVTNLGIGGSSIGRYWDQAFVDRYREIPQDTDLILVMGGTNDGFCLSQEELGSMQERKARTFIGDLDELLGGLKENYPNARVVLATPLPNVLHDILRKERDYLLPQSVLVNAMKELAAEHGIPVIDLYNSNILDTHDAAVIYNYMPDGVHCNAQGYTLLAEHFAAELIRMYEQQEKTQEETGGQE